MNILRSIPAALSALVLGAHFLRAGGYLLTGLCVVIAAAAFVPRGPVRLAVRAGLLAGVAVWAVTAWQIAQARMEIDAPWGRMALILAAVAAFTAVSAWLLPRDTRSSPVSSTESTA